MPSSGCQSLSERSTSASSTSSTPELRENSVVNNEWIVQRFLSNTVLLVKSHSNDRLFAAMTIEPWSRPDLETLRYDIYVLRLMQNSKHVPRIFESGSIPGNNFMVTSLFGQNLDSLRESMPSKRFTTGTSIRLAFQAVNAINDLHRAGFVHRNVKPSVFSFGSSASTLRTLQITDFSFARQIVTSPQARRFELRRAREHVIFRGCPRYCSVNVHRLKEPSPHDDIISVLFMAAEMVTGKLLWDNKRRQDIAATKKESPAALIFQSCPSELAALYEYLTKLTYYEQPDYEVISKTFNKILADRPVDLEDPYDWEEGGRYFYHKLKEERDRKKELKKRDDGAATGSAVSEDLTTAATDELYIPEVSEVNTLQQVNMHEAMEVAITA